MLTDLRNSLQQNIHEMIKTEDLPRFLVDLFVAIIPDTPQVNLLIDRAHRILKPKSFSLGAPRDVIARLHFYHFNYHLLYVARARPVLPDRFKDVLLFTDLSAVMLARRR